MNKLDLKIKYRNTFFVQLILLFIVLQTAIFAQNYSLSSKKLDNICLIDGSKIGVKNLTGLSAAETLEGIAAVKSWKKNKSQSFKSVEGTIRPGLKNLTEFLPGQKSVEDVYHALLHDALVRFLALQVIQKLDNDKLFFVDKSESMPKQSEIIRLGRLIDELVQINLETIDDGANIQEYKKKLKNKFPGYYDNWNKDDWQSLMIISKESIALTKIQSKLFPYISNNSMPSPWFEQTILSSYIPKAIEAAYQREKSKYDDIHDGQFGVFRMIFIHNLYESNNQIMQAMLDRIVSDTGEVSVRSIGEINQVLLDQNSSLQLRVKFQSGDIFQNRYSINPIKLPIKKIKTIYHEEKLLGIYLISKQVHPVLLEHGSKPGGFLYDEIFKVFLTPYVEEVLEQTTMYNDWTKPTPEEILYALRDGWFPDEYMGVKIRDEK